MNGNTVYKLNRDVVMIQNAHYDEVFITRLDNRVVVFSCKDGDTYITFVSKRIEDLKKLYEKTYNMIAQITLKGKDSMYFKAPEKLDLNNGPGVNDIPIIEFIKIKDACNGIYDQYRDVLYNNLSAPDCAE